MYTTPRAAEANMIRNLSTTGVKVEIDNKKDEIMKTYYVGGSTKDSYGTYMIMEGAEEPFVVHDPNFRGMLRGKYLKGDDDWKDLKVFGETVEEIESASVEYPKQKNKSFTVYREGGDFKVKPFHDATPALNREIQPGAAEKFLIGFSKLNAEAFQNELPMRDSISQTVPFAVLHLENKNGEKKSARLFPIVRRDQYGNPINYSDPSIQSSQAIDRYNLDYSDGSFRLGYLSKCSGHTSIFSKDKLQ
jgi:hypothetical protein